MEIKRFLQDLGDLKEYRTTAFESIFDFQGVISHPKVL